MDRRNIFEVAPFAACHASTIVECEPDKFLVAWFAGTQEGANDVRIWIARSEDGVRWTQPDVVAEERGVPCWNPVLFRERKSGEIILYYKIGTSPQTWSGFFRRSKDAGRTWGESFIMPAGLLGPIKNKPIQLDDGSVLSPTSVESYKNWACWVDRSVDGCRTWQRLGPIYHPKHAHGIIQPTLLKRRDGTLLLLARSRTVGQVCMSTSRDGGATWSPAEGIATLPNPNSGIDAVTLADGRHVLVYNPTHIGRTPLAIAVSTDDGATWKQALVLEQEPGEYSYPAIIQAADTTIHVTYTWNRTKIRHVTLLPKELG
jgi:predicted neuraminidase